eukprot:7627105-Heterocapsa_arctica.AAC.2
MWLAKSQDFYWWTKESWSLELPESRKLNWLRQMEGGIPQGIAERWQEYAVYTGPTRGPVNYYRRKINELGWQDIGIDSIIDDTGNLIQIDEWP